MRLPKDILSRTYTKPRLFLCETDKTIICKLDDSERSGDFKFNSYSELSFEVGRTYIDNITGEIKVNPYYDKIEALRLVYLEGFGYFEIQDPELNSDGIKESKSIKAYSYEYTLSQKFLSNLFVNTGEIDSREVIYADVYGKDVSPVVLYDPETPELSLLHLILEKIYGWRIGHVDGSLAKISRTFEVDRESVYDFIINEICPKFNCYAVFDTDTEDGIGTINLYAEALTYKPIGDGITKSFTITPPYSDIGTVSIDGYKTTAWEYNSSTGVLTFDSAPKDNARIEIVDGSQSAWETDVFVTFDNLSQEVSVSYSADDIKTVLTVTGSDDMDIREVNLGQSYIVDLSYYYSEDWMGKELYDAYTNYLKVCSGQQTKYTSNSRSILEINNKISFEENRVSLEYSVASVTSSTQGTYYIRGGEAPNYYYTEVSLPGEYNAEYTYYTLDGVDLTREKIDKLYRALQSYYKDNSVTELDKLNTVDEVTQRTLFDFMEYTISELSTNLGQATNDVSKKSYIDGFLDEMWNQYGKSLLENEKSVFDSLQTVHVEDGWANENEYDNRYTVDILFLDSITRAIDARQSVIDVYNESKKPFEEENSKIATSTELYNFFKTNYPENYNALLSRLSAFLREDEYSNDSFFTSDTDELTDIFKIKQELLECGRIELNKLCQPSLKCSMSMANIYALSEFEPIVDQFQLGRMIKIGIREGYVKRSRLMQVHINFEDFSDFSCEFGELISTMSQADLHADLLSQAVQAGKSVASNANYWNKGADKSNEIDLRIQQGLLDAATAIKSIDGTQNVIIDKYGIHLQKVDPSTGKVNDKQGWIVNNQFLYSDDGFKTTKSVFGEYKIENQTYWGLLAEAVIAGYIEGSQIKGGTIQIGEQDDGTYAFEVHDDGSVTMHGGSGYKDKYGNTHSFDGITEQIEQINSSKMYRVEIVSEGPTVISTKNDKVKMVCKVYSWDVDITNTLDVSLFKWKRISQDQTKDEDGLTADDRWALMPEHQNTKTIEIDAEDVVGESSFTCEVELPGLEEG